MDIRQRTSAPLVCQRHPQFLDNASHGVIHPDERSRDQRQIRSVVRVFCLCVIRRRPLCAAVVQPGIGRAYLRGETAAA